MPYTITHWSKLYRQSAGKSTAEKDTAAAAWRLVDDLMRSDETVEIASPSGRTIGWQELEMLAKGEAPDA